MSASEEWLRAWRLTLAQYVDGALTGEGARLYGGRWNHVGTPVVCLAESLALAALEVLVHTEDAAQLTRFVQIPVHFDEALVETLPRELLPEDWREVSPATRLQDIGERWVREQRSLVLQVPSVIIPEEHTFVVNPAHPQLRTATVGKAQPFNFDPRLVRRFARE